MVDGSPDVRRTCEERIVMFAATHGWAALSEAKRRGRAAQHRCKNNHGNSVHFEFVGVMDLPRLDPVCEADEVWYSITERVRPMVRDGHTAEPRASASGPMPKHSLTDIALLRDHFRPSPQRSWLRSALGRVSNEASKPNTPARRGGAAPRRGCFFGRPILGSSVRIKRQFMMSHRSATSPGDGCSHGRLRTQSSVPLPGYNADSAAASFNHAVGPSTAGRGTRPDPGPSAP